MTRQPGQRLTVRTGSARVAMAVSGVAEVLRRPRLTRVPNGPPGLLGVTHLRGVVLPVLSLARLLDEENPPGAAERVVVLRQDPPLGLAVDAVEALQAAADGPAPATPARSPAGGAEGAAWLELGAELRDRCAAAFREVGYRAARGPGGTAAAPAAAMAAPAAPLAFLAVTLAGQDYALPLEAVSEVLAIPAAIMALPATEAPLLGVFTLRGAVLPAISLRLLLGLPARPLLGEERVVVARVAGQRLAFVVDRLGSILRVAPDRVGPAPSLFNRGGGEARIDQVLRLADGRSLVAVLSPGRVLADDRLAQLRAAMEAATEEAMAIPEAATRRERLLVIRLGAESYGLPLGAVDEVLRLPEKLTRLPRAPAYVRGVMTLRGRVIPVIDQRLRFAVGGEGVARGRVVVVTLGQVQAGFAVDAVTDILEVDPAELLPAPELATEGALLFDRVLTVGRDGRVILMIDPAALLSLAEADLLRDLAASAGPA